MPTIAPTPKTWHTTTTTRSRACRASCRSFRASAFEESSDAHGAENRADAASPRAHGALGVWRHRVRSGERDQGASSARREEGAFVRRAGPEGPSDDALLRRQGETWRPSGYRREVVVVRRPARRFVPTVPRARHLAPAIGGRPR